MVILSDSEQKTEMVGKKFALLLKPHDIVSLYGGLGSGKTAFIRGVAQGLESTDTVSSPTYTIVNEYKCKGGLSLFHFDLYRLCSFDELYDIGWDDYTSRYGICVLEWCERADGLLDDVSRFKISLHPLDYEVRQITIEGDV